MVANIQGVAIPFEIMKPILIDITDSLTILKVFKFVSKDFKAVVENPVFLHSLLVKFKGNRFSDNLYAKDPRKFLALDRDITRAFKTIICKKSSFKNEKIMKIQKMISSIALKDLKLGVFTISHESNVEYYRFSETQIKKLNNTNFDAHIEWNECIENMANCIAEHDFPIQINFHFPKNIPYLKQIESAFLKPNKRMQTLIKVYEITDIFFGESSLLLINAHKGKELESNKIQEAVLEPEEHNRLLNFQLIHEFIENVNFIVQNDNISFSMNISIRNQILARLKNNESGQKDYVDENYTADPYKFLFGMIFQEIWPSNMVELGNEKCKNSFNYWLVKIFAKSVAVVVTNQETGKADVKCDILLRKFMINLLINPSSGLKTCIEETYKGTILSLCKDLLFREIWHNEPFDASQGVGITFNIDTKMNIIYTFQRD